MLKLSLWQSVAGTALAAAASLSLPAQAQAQDRAGGASALAGVQLAQAEGRGGWRERAQGDSGAAARQQRGGDRAAQREQRGGAEWQARREQRAAQAQAWQQQGAEATGDARLRRAPQGDNVGRDWNRVERPAAAWQDERPRQSREQAGTDDRGQRNERQPSGRGWSGRERNDNPAAQSPRSERGWAGQDRGDRRDGVRQGGSDWDRTRARGANGGSYDARAGNSRAWDNRGWDDRGWDDRSRDSRRWNNNWRQDRRYDWRSHRSANRQVYRPGRYYAPYRSSSYRRLGIGLVLQPRFYANRYWIADPWQYRLPQVHGPYRWVRYYDDVLLIDIYSGEVLDVIHDFFW